MVEREYLILAATERDRPGLVAELTGFIARRGCNVEDSRVAVLGGHAGLMFLISGSAAQIAAVQSALDVLERDTGLRAVSRRITGPPVPLVTPPTVRSYIVTASAIDHVGLIHAIADTVRANGGNIVELETSTESAPMTGSPLFALRMLITQPHGSESRLRSALDALARSGAMDVEMMEGESSREPRVARERRTADGGPWHVGDRSTWDCRP